MTGETAKDRAVFAPHRPAGLHAGVHYEVACDDKGRAGGTWLKVMVSAADSDLHVMMQDWEHIDREGTSPSFTPTLRIRTHAGGGRNHRTLQALRWLARAMQLDAEEQRRMRGG